MEGQIAFEGCEEIDNDDSVEYNEETGELIENDSKAGRPKARQAILQLSNKARARFKEGDPNIFFEIKINKNLKTEENNSLENKIDYDIDIKDDTGIESFKNDGYYGELLNLLLYSLSINIKEKLYDKNEVLGIKEMIKILKEAKEEAKSQTKAIIASINDNSCVKEITQDAIDRCKVK